MSLRYIEASIEGMIKKLEVLTVSNPDAQRCTEALNTFSIFNALSVLDEVKEKLFLNVIFCFNQANSKIVCVCVCVCVCVRCVTFQRNI